MSAGGRGTYSIRVDLDASQAIGMINTLRTQLGSLAPSFQSAGNAANQSAMQFTRFNTEAQKTVGTSSSLAGSLGQIRGPLGQLNSQIGTTAATLPKLASGQNQAALAGQKNAAAMQGQIQRATALGSRIGGVAFMFTGLTAAMGEAQGMQSLLAESQKKESEALVKMNDAIAKYGKESFQATRATEQWEKAQRAVAFQSRITTLSIQDQFFFIGGLASIALPSLIQVVGKLVTAMKTAQAAGTGFGASLGTAFSGVGTKLAGVFNAMTLGLNKFSGSLQSTVPVLGAAAAGTARNATVLSTYTVATGTATTATRTFGASLTALIRHPIVIAIAAIAAAYLVLQQNLFGVTDRIREFGVALGQAVPVLQPVLNLIDAIGASLGITGSAAVDAGEQFKKATDGFGNMATLWNDTLATMQRSSNEWVSTLGDNLVELSDAIAQQRTEIGNQLDMTIDTWNKFIDQLARQDYSAALDTLIAAVSAIPEIVGKALQAGADQLAKWGQLLVDAVGPGLEMLGQAISDGITNLSGLVNEAGNRIVMWIVDGIVAGAGLVGEAATRLGNMIRDGLLATLGPIGTWIQTNVIKPIQDQFNNIAGGIATIGQQVYDALGLDIIRTNTEQLVSDVTNLINSIPKTPTSITPAAPPNRFGTGGGQENQPRGPQFGMNMETAGGLTPIEAAGRGQGFTGPGAKGKGSVGLEAPRETRLLGLSTEQGAPEGITPALVPGLKLLREARKEQKGIGAEAKDIWGQYSRLVEPASRSVGDFTSFVKKYQEAEDTSDDVVNAAIKAQEAYTKVKQDGGDETAAMTALEAVFASEVQTSTEKAEAAKTVIGELREANKGLATTYDQTATAIKDQSLMQELSKQGTLEAKNAIVGYGSELIKNTAFNKEWGAAIDSNVFKQAAFQTGVQNQIAELNKQKVSVAENVGVLAEYTRQVESGEAGQVAFVAGQQKQTKSLLDSKVALSESAGALQVYTQQVGSGEAQQVAFVEGVQNQQKALLDSIVSLSEGKGALQEYTAQIASGIPQGVAFLEGIQETSRALLDSEVNMANMAGSLVRLNAALQDTTTAQVQFMEGFFEGSLAAAEFVLNIDKASGAFVGYRAKIEEAAQAAGITLPENVNISTESLQRQIELIKGSGQALSEFATSVNEAAQAMGEDFAGAIEEGLDFDETEEKVDEFVDHIEEAWGVEIPDSIKRGWEQVGADASMEKELAKQVSYLEGFVGTGNFEEQGRLIIEMLVNGMESMGPAAKQSAVALMAAIEEAINCQGCPAAVEKVKGLIAEFGDHMDETAGSVMETGKQMAASLIESFGSIAGAIEQLPGIMEQAGSMSEKVGTLGAGRELFTQQLTQMRDEAAGGVGAPTVDTSQATGQVDALALRISQLPEVAAAAAAGISAAFATIDLTGFTAKLGTAMEPLSMLGPATQTAVLQMRAAFDGIDFTGFTEKLRLGLEPLSLLGPATMQAVAQMSAAFAALDLTGLTEKLRLGLEPLTLLGPATTQAVAQMSAAFAALDLTGFTERLRIALEPLTLLGPATQQAVAQMSAAFASIDLSGFLIALQPIQQALTLLGPAAQQAAAQMSAALATVGAAAQTVGQQIQQSITTAIQQAAAAVQSASQQMNAALQTVTQQAATTAQSFAQIGQAAQQAASTVQSAASSMVSALQSVVGAAEAVAQSIQGIGSAAQSARSDVEALSSAIESIPDGDAVINVTWNVAPAPSGITGFGVGLGFSRSGTVTYSAGGSSGGGGGTPGFGGGGGLGGGQQFGGGGEPSLIFGAQGGLGSADQHRIDEFNKLGILAPVMIDHPTKMLVGENGPELVSVTPVNRNRTLKSGEMSPFVSKYSDRPNWQYNKPMQGGYGYGGGGPGGPGGGPGHGGGMGGQQFGGTINIGQGTVQFANSGPIQVNVMQGGAGATGGLGAGGAGLPTTGGGFGGIGGVGQPQPGFGQQGTFNVPGGQASVMGNAVACINGQCFGNTSGFGTPITNPLQQQQQMDFKPFEPVIKDGIIDAMETLKEWFKYLGLPLGGIGGAGLDAEGMKAWNPFAPTGIPGMMPGFGGGMGAFAGGGGAAAAAGGGGAMAMAGGAMAFAGRGGGMFGGGMGGIGQPTQLPEALGPHGNPQDWAVYQEAGPDGKWNGKYLVFNNATQKIIAKGFTTLGWAQQYIVLYATGAVPVPTGGPGAGGIPGGMTNMQGNPALLQQPFFQNFFGGGGMPTGGGGIPGGTFQGPLPPGMTPQQFVNNFMGGGGVPGQQFGGGLGGVPTGGVAAGGGGGGCSICGAASDLSGAANQLSSSFGGNAMATGNAVACVNGQCFGNMQGFGTPTQTPGFGMQQPFGGFVPADQVPTLTEQQYQKQLGQGGTPGMIQMTGGNINFDQNQGEVEMRTSTGAIAIAGPGGAFASAGRTTAGVGLFGQGPTTAEQQQLNQLEQMNLNLMGLNGQMNQQGQSIEFQQQQQQQTLQQMFGQPGGGFGGQPVGFQQPQQFTSPGFTGFGQTFQQFPGGGAVGSGTNDPLGFLNSMLGGFGIPTPAGIPGGGGVPATGGGVPGGVGTGGGVGCDVCGAIRSLGGAAVGTPGTGGGGTLPGGGGGVAPPGQQFGGGGEPSFIGGGGGIGTPTGGGGPGTTPPAPGQTTPGCAYRCRPMDSDPNRYRIDDAQGNESNGGVYYDTALACNQRLQELCPTSLSPGNNMTPAPTQQPIPFQPGGGYQEPGMQQPGGGMVPTPGGGMMQTGGGRAIAIAGGGGMLGGTPMTPVQPGMPIGNPPVPPRIVQTAGLPSQHVDVNQDPWKWTIVESAGLVGTYDIIDNSGDVVQLGFRTIKDAQQYLNYFKSYYAWLTSGTSGIGGPTPVGGGGGGIGAGGVPIGGGIIGPGGGGPVGPIPPGYGGGIGGPGWPGAGGGYGGGRPGHGGGGGCPYHCSNKGAKYWVTDAAGKYVSGVLTAAECDTELASMCAAAGGGTTPQYPGGLPSDFEGAFPNIPGMVGIGGNLTGGGYGGGGQFPGMATGGGGGVTATAGGAQASAGGGMAMASAGGALAIAGGIRAPKLGTGKQIGPTPTPETPFVEIPRAQGPFRSGQDNQEPIYDNSGIKVGADFGSPGETVTLEDVEEGGGGGGGGRGRGNRLRDRINRHIAAAMASAGGNEAWMQAFMDRMIQAFGDIVLNLTVNSNLDGSAIHRNQEKFMLKKVSVFA